MAQLSFQADSLSAIRRLRDQYMLAPDLNYLNHASIGTAPRPVVEAHAGYLQLCESHPSLYVWGGVWRELAEQARAQAAALLNCGVDDLAITHNTTEGFNILAHGLQLGPGDEILFSSINHAGAAVAWDALAERRGFSVRRFAFPVERGAELTAEEVVALHADAVRPETRVLVIPHVDNMIGLRHPMREIAAAAPCPRCRLRLRRRRTIRRHDPGGYRLVRRRRLRDERSQMGAIAQRTRSAVRLGGPQAEAAPHVAQDGGVEDGRHRPRLRGLLDAGVARGDALTFQAALGEAEKSRRYQALWRRVRDRVDAEPSLEWRSPREWSLSSVIMAVEVVGRAAPELGPDLLQAEGAVVRTFGGGLNSLRASPNLMTSEEELDRFMNALVVRGT